MADDIIQNIESIFDSLLDELNGADVVFLATIEGDLLYERNRKSLRINKIVPVSGSLLGISDSMGKQYLAQNLDHYYMIYDHNILGLFKLHDDEDSLFIGIVCNQVVNILSIRNAVQSTIHNLNHLLHQIVY